MDPSEYAKLPLEESKCIFLSDERLCKVYDDRPTACRTHQVLSDKELCNPKPNHAPDGTNRH